MNADLSDGNQRPDGHVNELSGTVRGPALQARDVHGGIHLHQASTPLPKPTQLPAGSVLVDRAEALALLDSICSDHGGIGVPKVAVISGPAGIGKTAVALHWSHRERGEFPDGQLFADLRGHAADAPVQPAEVLGRFIRAFGVAPERIPGGLAERSALYQSLVSERRLVVVLDDMTIRAALMLSYRGLSPPEAARVYRLLGLFPGATFDSWAAAATVTLPRAQVRRLLGVLTDANLLDDVPGGSYRFHDLTRLHARELAEQQEAETTRDQTVRRALDWFLYTASAASRTAMPYRRAPCQAVVYPPAEPISFTGSAQALDWLEGEFDNLRAAGRTAYERGLFPTAWQLVDALWPLFLYRGHHAERLEVDRLGLAAARACSDPLAEAKMLNRTGLALRVLGRLDEAADDFRRALDIWRREGDQQRMAGSRRRLGLVEMDRGLLDEAIALFEEALDGYRAAGEPRKVALTLCDLGNALIEKEREGEAVAYLGEARRLLAPEPDRYNQARVLILLGRARGGGSAAADLLTEGLGEMRQIGSETGEAQALQALGDLALRSRRYGEARDRYQEAQRILSRRGARSGRLEDRLSRLDGV